MSSIHILSGRSGKCKVIFHFGAWLFLSGLRLPEGRSCQRVRGLTHAVCGWSGGERKH